MILFNILIFLAAGLVTSEAIEFRGLQFWLNLLNYDWLDSKPKDFEDASNLGISKGVCYYSFINYVSMRDTRECGLREIDEAFNTNNRFEKRKPIIRVTCQPSLGNSTVHVVDSVKEVMAILQPYGNSTKRTENGSCALILFYTKSCTGSAIVAPHFNALAKQFPDIRVAAIDAFRFHNFNTEFGIVGLPTLLLFHQGRPIVKFNDTTSTVNSFVKFVTKHTGLRSSTNSVFVTSEDFSGPLSNKVERDPDILLYLAWAFIITCIVYYYYPKSLLYTQIVEMIKRNWRESEELLENS